MKAEIEYELKFKFKYSLAGAESYIIAYGMKTKFQ